MKKFFAPALLIIIAFVLYKAGIFSKVNSTEEDAPQVTETVSTSTSAEAGSEISNDASATGTPIVTFSVSPSVIYAGQSEKSVFTWTTQNATSCVLNGYNTAGRQTGTGVVSVIPGDQTYSILPKVTTRYVITCKNSLSGKTASTSVTVTVLK